MHAIVKEPTRRDFVVFGALLPVFTAVLGGLVTRFSGLPGAGRGVWVVGGVATLAFVAVPAWRRPIYMGWMRGTYPLGWLMTHVILSAVHLIVMAPIALLMRVLRIDPLQRRWDPAARTYWVSRDREPDVASYFRQY
ncbi:MAG TPA: SxtJ family membrane protein [Egibacteraceae bacterium]|nr:SxtJ family membrane protein [Egibacteraceae bacterium]